MRLNVTTDLRKLDRSHNGGLPLIATADLHINTLFIHPYFFELSETKQAEILARELVCYLLRGMRNGENILKEAKALLALKEFLEKARQIVGSAEIVVGVPFHKEFDTIENVCRIIAEGLRKYYPGKKAVLFLLGNPDMMINQEIARRLDVMDLGSENIRLMTFVSPVQGKGMAMRLVMESSLALNAEGSAFIDADERKVTPEWPHLLIDPVLSGQYDFVSARYLRHHHTATITNHFAYPVMAAIYGKAVRQPIGGEFAFSKDMMTAYLKDPNVWTSDAGTYGVDNWLTSTAIVNSAAMCEVDLGVKEHNFSHFNKRSTMLMQVAKTLFAEIRQNIRYWREIDSIRSSVIAGPVLNMEPAVVLHDFRDWIRSAREGYKACRRIYSRFLSPEASDFLEHLFSANDEEFNLTPERWADYVYEFIKAYLVTEIGAQEVFWEALAALWQARVGTFIKKTPRGLSANEAERVIEDQLEIFAAKKPNFVGALKEAVKKNGAAPSKVEVLRPLPYANAKVFVFDWDGTVIRTLPEWKGILKEVLSELTLNIGPGVEGLPYHLGSAGVVHWAVREAKRRGERVFRSEDEYAAKYVQAINKFFGGLRDSDRVLPGAKEFLTRLSGQGRTLFVLTAAYKTEKIVQARALGMDGMFEEIIGKEHFNELPFQLEQFRDTLVFKREQLRRIKKERGLSKHEIVMFGDSPFDILSAKEAGAIAVGIARDEETREALIRSGADIIINGDYEGVDLLPVLSAGAATGTNGSEGLLRTGEPVSLAASVSKANVMAEATSSIARAETRLNSVDPSTSQPVATVPAPIDPVRLRQKPDVSVRSEGRRSEMREQQKNEIKSSLKNLDSFVKTMVRLRQTLAEEKKGPGLLSRWLFEMTRNDAAPAANRF